MLPGHLGPRRVARGNGQRMGAFPVALEGELHRKRLAGRHEQRLMKRDIGQHGSRSQSPGCL